MLGMGMPSMNTSPTLPKWPPSTRYGLLPLPSTHPNHSRICPRTSIPSLNLNIPAAQAAASAAPTFSLLSQPLSPHPPTPQDAPSTSVTSPPPHPSMSSPTSSTLAPSNPSGSSQKNPVSLSPFSTVPQQPRCQHQNLVLHGQKLKIGWGNPALSPGQVSLTIGQSNASRNVYLSGRRVQSQKSSSESISVDSGSSTKPRSSGTNTLALFISCLLRRRYNGSFHLP